MYDLLEWMKEQKEKKCNQFPKIIKFDLLEYMEINYQLKVRKWYNYHWKSNPNTCVKKIWSNKSWQIIKMKLIDVNFLMNEPVKTMSTTKWWMNFSKKGSEKFGMESWKTKAKGKKPYTVFHQFCSRRNIRKAGLKVKFCPKAMKNIPCHRQVLISFRRESWPVENFWNAS